MAEQLPDLDVLVLGVGAGATCVYHQESSSAFVIRSRGQPLLLLDAGLGVVVACRHHECQLPQHIYISHNHSDHSGELPVLLAVEAASGKPRHVLAESQVLSILQEHRLHELLSTGQPLEAFASFTSLQEGQRTQVASTGLWIQPVRSQHKERCFGLVLYLSGKAILGFTADSGADAQLYQQLAQAPVVLVDARAKSSTEHASFDEVEAAAASGPLQGCRVLVYGYGTLAEAPSEGQYQHLEVLRPGRTILLSDSLPKHAIAGAADAARSCQPSLME